LHRVKLSFGEVAVREDKSYRFQIDDVEEHVRFTSVSGAGGYLLCHEVAFLAELRELSFAFKDGFRCDGDGGGGIDCC